MSNRMMTDAKEMQRRWDLLLARMEKEALDCLFMWSTDRIFSAYLRYVTDYPTILYPLAGLFSAKGISVFGHGAMGDDLYPPETENRVEEEGKFHFIAGGIARHDFVMDALAVPSAPTTTYAPWQMPQKVTELIKKYGYKRIGLVGMSTVPAIFPQYFRENIPGVELVDATRLVDEVKSVKSPYEIAVAEDCVRMIDEIILAAPSVMKPGLTVREIGRKIRRMADGMDCMDLNIMLGKHPTMPIFDSWEFTDEVPVEKGDCIELMVEVSNHVGFWGECARVYSLGEPCEELKETAQAAFEVQEYVAGLMRPGAVSCEVFEKACDFLAGRGFPREQRFIAHGQGYDVVEMPFIRPENAAALEEGMFVAIHPSIYLPAKKTGCFVCDNFLTTPDGARRMNKAPKEIIRVYSF